MPLLIECFNVINEENGNSIFSLIGNNLRPLISLIECLNVVMSTLGPRVEQFAHMLISRAIAIVIPILGYKTQVGKVNEEERK
jgi:sorbitol-specific phosphotransferase system component IIC